MLKNVHLLDFWCPLILLVKYIKNSPELLCIINTFHSKIDTFCLYLELNIANQSI